MARKTFFSFHFEGDSWRAGQVRNSNVIPIECETGFMDACDWKRSRRRALPQSSNDCITTRRDLRHRSIDRHGDRWSSLGSARDYRKLESR